MNDDQQRFGRALTSTVDAMAADGKYPTENLERIAVGKPALPYCEKTLEHVRDGGLGSPFTNKADVLVFRAEVEATLSADALDALWDGEVDGVSVLFDEPVSNLEAIRFALIYLDDAGIHSQHSVRLDLIERMGDVRVDKKNERLVDQEPGARH